MTRFVVDGTYLVGLSHSGPKNANVTRFRRGGGHIALVLALEAGTLVTVIFKSCHIDQNRITLPVQSKIIWSDVRYICKNV